MGPVAALATHTRRTIAAHLAGAPDGLTVAELAALMGLHPNAVRRQLGTLASAGAVIAGTDAPHGRGRPRVRYRLADASVAVVAAHRELVSMLVGLVTRLGGDPAAVEAFGVERGFDLMRGRGRDAVLASLAGLGFAPHDTTPASARDDGALNVRLDHCPFREAVLAPGGDAICTLHRGLLRGMASAAAPSGRLEALEPHHPVGAGCVVRMRGLQEREAA